MKPKSLRHNYSDQNEGLENASFNELNGSAKGFFELERFRWTTDGVLLVAQLWSLLRFWKFWKKLRRIEKVGESCKHYASRIYWVWNCFNMRQNNGEDTSKNSFQFFVSSLLLVGSIGDQSGPGSWISWSWKGIWGLWFIIIAFW